jgi:ATP adenylyltransferase/5',5'''-P-1,P-4-tetraphosphate phosphorylase II
VTTVESLKRFHFSFIINLKKYSKMKKTKFLTKNDKILDKKRTKFAIFEQNGIIFTILNQKWIKKIKKKKKEEKNS